MSVVAISRRPLDISLTGAWRYWYRNMIVFRRIWLLGIMAWFAEPVIYLVAMGLGLGQYLESVQGVEYINFIAPGLLAVSTMFGATFSVTWDAWFKMERSGVYHAAASTPLSFEDIALGETFWGATRGAIYGGAFAVIATFFGVYQSWWGLLAIPAIVLVGLVFSITGLIYCYVIERVDYLAYYWTLFITPMFMFSGVFFPLERLPDWVRTFAWFMPLHHATNLMRSLMTLGDPKQALASALWLATLVAGLIIVPPMLLRRRLVA